VLVRLNLRKFIEDCLRQFALFEVEHAIISEQEPAARLPVGLFVVEVFRALLSIVNLLEHDNRALLAFADVSAKFVSLADREPER
jgi:hypothetical protein